jgi:hypothetical protein
MDATVASAWHQCLRIYVRPSDRVLTVMWPVSSVVVPKPAIL